MQRIMKAIRLSLMYVVVLILASSSPLSALAATESALSDATATTSSETAPAGATPSSASETTASEPVVASEPTAPVTSEAAPSTSQAPEKPTKPKETYTYNTETGHWDSNRWQYNPTTGKYERPPEFSLPAQSSIEGSPSPVIVTPDAAETGGATKQAGSAEIDSETKNVITNIINSGALSGDAAVENNTKAGNATSGNASAAATIINNVNSTMSSGSNQKAATFVSDITGDVHGDIILQPMLLKAMLEAGAQASSGGSASVTNTNQLVNNVNLSAESGSATVVGNTSAGNATTGDANTVANVLNIVNSMVAANRSFVGTINIYGNLDGDILVAPDFIPQMLANNGAASSSQTTKVSSKDTQSIVNNIALAAETGQAVVAGNTSAGNATTGDANTNIVLFNLTGHEIIASNSLLVFVNVLGKWVGVIVDAPTGATAAAIGNGVTKNTTSPDLVIDVTTDTQITNNINLTSLSGNATVVGNTRAGNATSGNATASANIGNIVGTQMGLSDWFGVLFINVFGSWNGSFGIDTLAGNRPVAAGSGGKEQAGGEAQPLRVIDFVPRSPSLKRFSGAALTVVDSNGRGGYEAANLNDQPQVALTSEERSSVALDEGVSDVLGVLSPTNLPSPEPQLPWLSGAIFLTGLSLVGTSMFSDARRRSSQLKQQ